jgi:AhpD family alkylhydroperoxidase
MWSVVFAHPPDDITHHHCAKSTPIHSKAEKEMIVVATSAANRCTYCVVAHGALLRYRCRMKTTTEPAPISFGFSNTIQINVPLPNQIVKSEFSTLICFVFGCIWTSRPLIRVYAKDAALADKIAIDYRKAGLTRRQVCMLEYAMMVSRDADAGAWAHELVV